MTIHIPEWGLLVLAVLVFIDSLLRFWQIRLDRKLLVERGRQLDHAETLIERAEAAKPSKSDSVQGEK